MDDQEYEYIGKVISRLLDIHIDRYRSRQMRRRLESYVDNTKALSIAAYCRHLETDEAEQQKLKNFLTINVSEFFRDDLHFTNLKEVILPDLLRRQSRLKIWSAGCSNGAEIYSIAMFLNELVPNSKHQLLATDIDDAILTLAKEGGPYPDREVKNVSKWKMEKHFNVSDGKYYVKDNIKRLVQFRKLDLMQDPFQKYFDLIVCRNVIIYFTDETRRKLFRQFHESLKEGGILFIGGSEIMIGTAAMGYDNVAPSFYRKVTPAVSAKT